jgi:hypothetical protein
MADFFHRTTVHFKWYANRPYNSRRCLAHLAWSGGQILIKFRYANTHLVHFFGPFFVRLLMDHSPTPPLVGIEGGRAALEMEALLTIPHDFQKFLAMTRALQRPANSALVLVPATTLPAPVSDPGPKAP